MYVKRKTILIITEKPHVARKITEFLFKNFKTKKFGRVIYFEAYQNGIKYVIAPAVGHLFGLETSSKGYPVFNYNWKKIFLVEKNKNYAKDNISLFEKLKNEIDDVIIATDYDIEGELIGYNILRFCLGRKYAKRMIFSEITPKAIRKAFFNLKNIDINLAIAGETRHILDFLYGINLSRYAQDLIGLKNLSIGRVQTPVLKIIYQREKEIENFKPEIFYRIILQTKYFKATHIKEKFKDLNEAKNVLSRTNNYCNITKIIENIKRIPPPPPFNLTSLQQEAWKIFKIKPHETLKIAQRLYEYGYISYPRTSSEKYPKDFNFKEILEKLLFFNKYKQHIEILLKYGFKVTEGKKTDPAHPCIYPTGYIPEKLTRKELAIYHLIVRRFLATLSYDLILKEYELMILCGNEIFKTKGINILKKGWLNIYPSKLNIQIIEIPEKRENIPCKVSLKKEKTRPPERFTPGSLVKLMEELNLGTKATRSIIIEKLYKRGYIKGNRIKITDLGKQIVEHFEKEFPIITSVELTRNMEEKLEKIIEGKERSEVIIKEAKEILTEFFKKKRQKNINSYF